MIAYILPMKYVLNPIVPNGTFTAIAIWYSPCTFGKYFDFGIIAIGKIQVHLHIYQPNFTGSSWLNFYL